MPATNDLNTRIQDPRLRYTAHDFRHVVIALDQILIEIRDGVQLNPYTRTMTKVDNPLWHATHRLSEIFELDPHQPHDLYWGAAAIFVDIPSAWVPNITENKAENLGADDLGVILDQALFFTANIVKPACKELDEDYRGYVMFATRNAIKNLRVAKACLEGTHGHRIS